MAKSLILSCPEGLAALEVLDFLKHALKCQALAPNAPLVVDSEDGHHLTYVKLEVL